MECFIQVNIEMTSNENLISVSKKVRDIFTKFLGKMAGWSMENHEVERSDSVALVPTWIPMLLKLPVERA